ncbi:unnamed protein product [Clavelina lepadiformis]|uniref:Uncharacterized protein n=1 Tax=Clavelina lepadiformis TaxID=159417 RepID=A0ABP0G9B7_CLALP
MAKKARKARRAIGCEQVLVEESDKESADNSDEKEESSDKEHDDASWNKREVVGFINLLQEALRERDSELKDMQDKLAEEMQNSADLRHKIKNKDKELLKIKSNCL